MVSAGSDGCEGCGVVGLLRAGARAWPTAGAAARGRGRRREGSGGSEGQRVEVVGENRPGGPGASAGVAFQAGSVEAVAPLEVADAAFGADAEAGEPAVGLAGVRG